MSASTLRLQDQAGFIRAGGTLTGAQYVTLQGRRGLQSTSSSMSVRRFRDQFGKRAQAAGYLARSAFKLLEVQQKHNIIQPGSCVLDLGCAPGAWLQVACQALGPQGGSVLGFDVQGCAVPRQHCDGRVTVLQGDAMQLSQDQLKAHCQGFHTVLSDMCPATMGYAALDVAASLQLASQAAELAVGALDGPAEAGQAAAHPGCGPGVLLQDGHLLVKLLEGAGTKELAAALRPHFRTVRWLQPRATRSESREVR